jgi:hypothetical protein
MNEQAGHAEVITDSWSAFLMKMKIPVNPFNEKDTVEMLADGQAFPANADDSHGWIYKAATSEIRADNTGTNLNGKPYYDF